MVDSRTVTAVAGVLVSLLVSVLAWVYLDTVLLFLVVPFVPFLLDRRNASRSTEAHRCPVCGFETTTHGFEYCPRDGTPLESPDRRR